VIWAVPEGVSGLLIVTAGLIVVTAAAAVSSLALLLAGSVIAGAGQGLAFMGLLAGVSGAAPDHQRGEVVSAFYVATWLGAALPVLAVGFAAPGIGLLRAAWIFTAVIAVVFLGATAGLLKLKHTTAAGRSRPARRLKGAGC
jgi:MFS family permease